MAMIVRMGPAGNKTLLIKGVVNPHRGARLKFFGNRGWNCVYFVEAPTSGKSGFIPGISWRIGSAIRSGLYQMTLTATNSDFSRD